MAKVKFKSPVGELMWCFIAPGGTDTSVEKTGDPKAMKKVANVVLKAGTPELAQVQEQLKQIWENFRESEGIKQVEPKSNGLKANTDKETGEPTGDYTLCFKTSATFKDGKDVKIPIYNAKGVEVDLGDKRIGNGSIGIIHGEAAIYEFGGKKGITLYLKAIQLVKYVEPDAGIDTEDLTVLYPDAWGEPFEAPEGGVAPVTTQGPEL